MSKNLKASVDRKKAVFSPHPEICLFDTEKYLVKGILNIVYIISRIWEYGYGCMVFRTAEVGLLNV